MCKYESKYLDYAGGGVRSFKCGEKEVKDDFCIFHHPEYWKENPKEVAEKLYGKVKSSIRNHEKLFCIGYNLPDITIWEEVFSIPVYFDQSRFHGIADFSWAEFTKGAGFFGAEFTEEADFVDLKIIGGKLSN